MRQQATKTAGDKNIGTRKKRIRVINTVSENNIGASQMQTNIGAINMAKFDFYLLLLVKLLPLILFALFLELVIVLLAFYCILLSIHSK